MAALILLTGIAIFAVGDRRDWSGRDLRVGAEAAAGSL
jgi:hypothetical protein